MRTFGDEICFSGDEFAEWLLMALSCATSEGEAIYCCGPITSGRAAFEWSRRNSVLDVEFDDLPEEMQNKFRREVIDKNIEELHKTAELLRQTTRRTVIDPARLPPIKSWRQARWRSFWCAFIRKNVSSIVAISGWEYSTGAAGEFAFALSLGMKAATVAGDEITANIGREWLLAAISAMEGAGKNVDAFRDVLQIVEGLCAKPAR